MEGTGELTWGPVACGIAALATEKTSRRVLYAMQLLDLTGSEELDKNELKECSTSP